MKTIEERRNRELARAKNERNPIRAPHVDKTAISPYDNYCDGYGMPGSFGNGYVNVLKVSTGTIKKTNDELIDGIVSYDRAEINDAYIGQINMLTASSFCGLAGQIWGYDLARHDDIETEKSKPLFSVKQYNKSSLDVYDAKPLLDAGIELFGTEKDRRYHLVPGAHTICANKGITASRPKKDRALKEGEAYGVWSYIAISISNDRNYAADLFIEDAGIWTKNDNEAELKDFLDQHRKEIVWSVVECGRDSHVLFDRTYIGYSYVIMKPGEIGDAITVGPYITLARNAITVDGFSALNEINLSGWLKAMDFKSLTGLR